MKDEIKDLNPVPYAVVMLILTILIWVCIILNANSWS